MKMSQEHYSKLETEIKKVLEDTPNLYHVAKEQGHTDMRFRWDLFWQVIDHGRGINPLPYTMFSQYDDSHIDTALRKITETIQ